MNLKKLMNEKGVSAAELADALHVSKRRVEGWMYGEREPNIHYLIGLAAALGCTVDELIRPDRKG